MGSFLCPIKEGSNQPALITLEELLTYQELNKRVEEFQGKLRSLQVTKLGLYCLMEKDLIPFLFAAFRENISLFIANPKLPFSFVEKKGKELGITLFLSNLDQINNLPTLTPTRMHIEEEQPLYLLTSGSTGEPKIATLRLGGFYYSAIGSIPTLNLNEGDIWQLSLPIYHVSGIALLFRTFIAKAAISLSPKDVTHLSYVPTQLYRLLQNPEAMNKIKCILLGGAPIPPHLYLEGKKRGLPLFLTYGLTEMSSSVLITSNPFLENGVFYLGEPLPFREMKLEDGEIFVRGKTLFAHPGWYATKDLGTYKPDHGFAILGRKDRMFISGGENIQPEEIERALLENTNVQEVFVLPANDPEYGQVPIAYIKTSLSIPQLKSYLLEKLPTFKIPRQFLPISENIFGKKIL
ncbi:MAG TPA: AMP-binding protein [Chlamydiales bacterium]|nr:AMP-binding protein [Chlamydiales bacterium]